MRRPTLLLGLVACVSVGACGDASAPPTPPAPPPSPPDPGIVKMTVEGLPADGATILLRIRGEGIGAPAFGSYQARSRSGGGEWVAVIRGRVRNGELGEFTMADRRKLNAAGAVVEQAVTAGNAASIPLEPVKVTLSAR